MKNCSFLVNLKWNCLFVCRSVSELKYPFSCAILLLHKTKPGQKNYIVTKHGQECEVRRKEDQDVIEKMPR